MNICVPIIEILNGGEIKGRGEFEFSSIPTPGDKIIIPSTMGDLDIMKVLCVEHSPIPLPRDFFNEDKKPSLRIYVEFMDDYSGE